MENITSIALAIVGVAMITAVLRRGNRAAQVITASGRAFSGSIRAALG